MFGRLVPRCHVQGLHIWVVKHQCRQHTLPHRFATLALWWCTKGGSWSLLHRNLLPLGDILLPQEKMLKQIQTLDEEARAIGKVCVFWCWEIDGIQSFLCLLDGKNLYTVSQFVTFCAYQRSSCRKTYGKLQQISLASFPWKPSSFLQLKLQQCPTFSSDQDSKAIQNTWMALSHSQTIFPYMATFAWGLFFGWPWWGGDQLRASNLTNLQHCLTHILWYIPV